MARVGLGMGSAVASASFVCNKYSKFVIYAALVMIRSISQLAA